ncbi:cytochrome P450 [Herbihabitans rhizosphaerae]|uniref:Cytochrome P450 n=1 Tax=Herbihabitans rhizosphaerae TaxID=1872711 RepID=A0A4Q7KI72_9PSEU|nr:cytochrome P450 [Herbihabitans rhizosphaerae]RZS34869.1 cytochrome P450 [Herbihabitans rhizosphaerae]
MATIDVERTGTSPSLPDGPKLPKAVQTLLFMTARHKFVPRWRQRYGEAFTIRLSFGGGRNVVIISRPEHIREVFAGAPEGFHAGESNRVLAPVMGEHSVLIQDGEDHKRSRKRLMPAFNGAALRGYGEMMTTLAEKCADVLPVGRPFEMHRQMNDVTLEIILRVVFGMTDEHRLAELRPTIRRLVNIGPVAVFGWASPRLRRYWPWKRNQGDLNAADALIYKEIAARRTVDDLAERTDVLSRLLVADPDMADIELRDHMMTLLLAGHETTATALAWSFHELARNPDVLRRAQQAADTGDEEYLSAVAKEAMRLRPVVLAVGRKLTEDTTVAGMRLPSGTVISPSIALVHADDTLHPAPGDFQPERFIGHGPEAGTWIPFGGGVRRCIGASFSVQEAAAVLQAVLSRYDVRPDRERPEPGKMRNITMVPTRGARVILTPR